MLKNEITSFEKQLKKLSGSEFKIFDEVVEMIINLLKTEITANHDELMKRVTKNIKFDSVENIQEFLSGYFNLQNEIIKEFDSFNNIESDIDFDKAIFEFTKVILQTIPKKDLRVTLAKSMSKVYTFVLDMYKIEYFEDEKRFKKSINDAFGNDDVTMLFLSTYAIIGMINEDIKISFDETVKLSSPFFIFCMAINDIRKENYLKSREYKKTYGEPANEINYNVGRNEPCPCGSSKKYKKCCLAKQEANPLDAIAFKEPIDIPNSLSEKEVTEFYAIWSKLVNFVSKIYSEVYEKQYTPIYKKDKFGKYLLEVQALKDNYCLQVNDFLLSNFHELTKNFLLENKVTKQQEKELLEFRDFHKSSQYYSFEKFQNGNAIFWDTQNNNCYYVNRCYDNFSTLLPKHAPFNTTLLLFRDRIVFDGIIGEYGMVIGKNMQNSLKEEYEKNRDKIFFKLEKNEKPINKIYQLKILIKGSKPPIWRRILVPSHISFYGLHSIIQNIFNWEDYHLYEFAGDLTTYTDKEAIQEDDDGLQTKFGADKFSIETELKNEKDKIDYTYDFGDDWEHKILLEKILIADESIIYPICIGGRREGPLEDCGGIYRYNEIAEAIEKPTSDNQYLLVQYQEYFDDFDPSFLKKSL